MEDQLENLVLFDERNRVLPLKKIEKLKTSYEVTLIFVCYTNTSNKDLKFTAKEVNYLSGICTFTVKNSTKEESKYYYLCSANFKKNITFKLSLHIPGGLISSGQTL